MQKSNMTEEEIRRLSWRCRRGLLELDIVLQRFSEKYLAGLSNEELVAFNRILDLPDNDFLDLLTARTNTQSHRLIDLHAMPSMQNVLEKLKQN